MFICLFSITTSGYVLFTSRYSYIRSLSMTPMQFWTNDHSFGSFEVIWGHIHVFPLTVDRIEIKRWGWSQCVSLAQTHRLICNMTYLARHVISHDLWPEVKFWHWPFRVNMYIFLYVSTRGTRCCQNYVASFLRSKVICKYPFLQIRVIWTFLDLCSLTHWL